MVRLFDTHAHLNFPKLRAKLDELLDAARDQQVHRILTIGASDGLGSNYEALEIARAYEHIQCSAGIHPHDAGECTQAWLDTIRDEFSELPEVLAIGEAGLDYHYDKAPRQRQHEVFRFQLQLAKAVNKPLIIHSRDAEEDTLRLFDEEEYTGGVLHCFTGSRPFAEAVLERGFMISFSGIVTFKNGRELLEIARDVPLDRLLVETDAPFLAPVPRRGKTNQPAFVRHTAEAIAEVRGITLEALARATWENGSRMFNWDVPYDA